MKKIQDEFQFKPLTPDLDVEDLFFLILGAGHKKPKLISDESFWSTFTDSPYDKD